METKVSTQGRKFRATAEQVLNHVLPALAGIKPNVTIHVEYHGRSGLAERGDWARNCTRRLSELDFDRRVLRGGPVLGGRWEELGWRESW